MARANFQVLVLPFTQINGTLRFCVFTRADSPVKQFIAGGGENNETPPEAAKREAFEEAGIASDAVYYTLDTRCSIPASCFRPSDRAHWPVDCFVVTEHAFAVQVNDTFLSLSHEHGKYEWMDYTTAMQALTYDSNKTALWELCERLKCKMLFST